MLQLDQPDMQYHSQTHCAPEPWPRGTQHPTVAKPGLAKRGSSKMTVNPSQIKNSFCLPLRRRLHLMLHGFAARERRQSRAELPSGRPLEVLHVTSLHANLLCIVQSLTDDPRRQSWLLEVSTASRRGPGQTGVVVAEVPRISHSRCSWPNVTCGKLYSTVSCGNMSL